MKSILNRRAAASIAVIVIAAHLAGCAAVVEEGSTARLAKAEAMFAERCKKSGEFIHRTVDGVEGILLMKVRPKNTDLDFGRQFEMNDPYGRDSEEESYIKAFFASYHRVPDRPPPGWKPYLGYAFVDAVDPSDSRRYRYTGSVRGYEVSTSPLDGEVKKFRTTGFVLEKALAPEPPPRYGITYDDISTREEHEYWIAGSSLRVIDLQTNEVIAERVGYMMDRGQGSNSGGRSPWLMAASTSCPAFAGPPAFSSQRGQTYRFVIRVLRPKPTKGD